MKLCILFPLFYIFSFTFYIKFDQTYQIFLAKKLTMEKGKIFFKKIFENCAFYFLDTEPELEPEPEPEPEP
jgi:hypothetical protein